RSKGQKVLVHRRFAHRCRARVRSLKSRFAVEFCPESPTIVAFFLKLRQHTSAHHLGTGQS
ncbi:MAG TPA: hypothetical protein VJ044_14465, partial [Candidatus Hodarchaeales archaeon]|nr:hypothetical protein [Candidatus Hodarchaeales archaeon]